MKKKPRPFKNFKNKKNQHKKFIEQKKDLKGEKEKIYRKPPGQDNLPDSNYELLKEENFFNTKETAVLNAYNFHPWRAFIAKLTETPINVIKFVAFFEIQFDVFFEDSDWLGLGLETVVVCCLIKMGRFDIRHEPLEDQWYYSDGSAWRKCEFTFLVNLISKKYLQEIAYGGNELKLKKSYIEKALLAMFSI